jgi:ankyrin repeat protein
LQLPKFLILNSIIGQYTMSKALKAAIDANDPDAVRKALTTVKDLNRTLPGANKPLLYACEKGADKVIELLVNAGALAEKPKGYVGESAFAVAAEHGKVNVLERLLALNKASPEAVQHALQNAAMDGRKKVVEFILDRTKPPITGKLFRLCNIRPDRELIQMLIDRGGDINAREDTASNKGVTVMHHAAEGGNPEVMRMLVELGADVNVRDFLGRTPLIYLATELESIERDESPTYAVKAIKTLLELGADASLTDTFGNDALTYYEFETGRNMSKKVVEILSKAGARGLVATKKLFDAIRTQDGPGLRQAIRDGADLNHISPRGGTPLIWAADSEEICEILLEAGADPNKPGTGDITPLIQAARSGQLAVVKCLLKAGANLHALEDHGEFRQNAYLAAQMNRQYEMADYLKSLGAGQPRATTPQLLKAGVQSWNDFSELLVKADVPRAAKALAKIISGKASLNVYGQSFTPGKKSFVVVRPKGMEWSNVFQITPPLKRFEEKQIEHLARELAKASSRPVLSVMYSDTSDAVSTFGVEPNGKVSRDAGWDHDTLNEFTEAMGDEAPSWAKKKLAKTSEDDPSSTERLVSMAEKEKFVVAAFGPDFEAGRKLEIEFPNFGPESFDGVAFVTN